MTMCLRGPFGQGGRARSPPRCRIGNEMGTPGPGFVPMCRCEKEMGTPGPDFVPRCRVGNEVGTQRADFVPGYRGEGG